MVMEEIGKDSVREKVGDEKKGMKLNYVIEIEINKGKQIQKMVNEGEIENERIVKGDKEDERWKNIME